MINNLHCPPENYLVKSDNVNAIEVDNVVVFALSKDNTELNCMELCDGYYERNLSKQDVSDLINHLIRLKGLMK